MGSRFSVLTACVGMALAASLSWGQAPAEKKEPAPRRVTPDRKQPAEKKPAANRDGESKEADSDTAKAEFPQTVKKDLHAQKDFRGKKAPTQNFGTWLNKKPDMKDKVILIDFWATWCGPCKRLMPELAEWQETFKDDLVVIGLSDEKVAAVKGFFKSDSDMKYPMAVDPRGTMKKALGVNGIPHVLIIGTDGIVRWQGFPGEQSDRLTDKVVKQIIDADKARRAAEADKKGGKKKDSTSDKSKETNKDSKEDSKKDSNSDSDSDSDRDSKSDSDKDSGTAKKGGGR